MKRQIFNRVVLQCLIVSGMFVGCTDNGKVQKANEREEVANRREAEASAATAKAESMQKDYEQKIATAKLLAATNQKDADVLADQIADFKTKQADRENLLLSLQGQVESETKKVAAIKEQHARVSAEIAAVEQKIESERASLAEEKAKTTAEITSLKEKTDKEISKLKEKASSEVESVRVKAQQEIDSKEAAFKQKADQLSEKIVKADERSKVLDLQEQRLNTQKSEQEAKASSLAQLEKAAAEREATFQAAIQTTKEFFVKNSVGDIFERVDAQKKFVFLVNVIGYGSGENASYIRKKIDGLQASGSKYKDLQSLTKLQSKSDDINSVKDSILVEAKGQDMKSVRDEVDAYLQAKNSNGESSKFNSLWMVIRPVEKVNVGLKLEVYGSEDKYFDGRTSSVIATFSNIASAKSNVLGISNLDLTKPGSYFFNSSESARVCETVSVACLKTLKREGFLDAVQTMSVRGEEGKSMSNGSYSELLSHLLYHSITQSVRDLKSKTVVGISLDKFDNMSWTFDTDAMWDKWGFGSRIPVVDDIQITYTVNMVESINTVSNHMDAAQYLFSGEVGKSKMFDLANRKRGEISIPLPIKKFSASRSELKDLSLKDFSTPTPVPAKPAELVALEAKMKTQAFTRNEHERLTKLTADHKKSVEAVAEIIMHQKQQEFERRSVTNAGTLSSMVDALRSK